jgi:dTDP-4-dehydrorhamnose 3,5-epimerase
MPFKSFRKLEVPDVILVEFVGFPDERGFFAGLYKRTDFLTNDTPYDFVQVNLSFSRRAVSVFLIICNTYFYWCLRLLGAVRSL